MNFQATFSASILARLIIHFSLSSEPTFTLHRCQQYPNCCGNLFYDEKGKRYISYRKTQFCGLFIKKCKFIRCSLCTHWQKFNANVKIKSVTTIRKFQKINLLLRSAFCETQREIFSQNKHPLLSLTAKITISNHQVRDAFQYLCNTKSRNFRDCVFDEKQLAVKGCVQLGRREIGDFV